MGKTQTQTAISKLSITSRVGFECRKVDSASVQSNIGFDDEYTPAADNIPYVSCTSYVVIDADKNKIIKGKNDG